MSVLAATGLSVRFGGHLALNGVDLSVSPGTVTGLIGPNGAGKTTLFNVLCGMQPAVAGRVRLAGDDITDLPTHERARRGMARTFQRLEVFGSLSVRENLQVAAEQRARLGWAGIGVDRSVDEALAFVGIDGVADRLAGTLPTGQARLVELARALVLEPKVLLLDEPASGLDADETGAFTALLGELAGRGLGILLVEHDMPLVMSTCSVVHVLDFGSLLAVGTPEEVQTNPAVLDAYLGAGSEKN